MTETLPAVLKLRLRVRSITEYRNHEKELELRPAGDGQPEALLTVSISNPKVLESLPLDQIVVIEISPEVSNGT